MAARVDIRAHCVTIVVLSLVSAGRARAQQSPPGQPEAVLFGKIPAVTGASRFEQEADEAPASITVITADEIARQGWRTLAEVLQSVRGVYATYDRNYTYLAVRGFGRPGDYNTRVLVLLDGQRINDNVYGATYYGTESEVEVELIDRVEVIRGPGSSLYGTGAFFGVVNIVTKRGRDLRGSELTAADQSYQGRGARVTLGTRFRSGVEVLASGSLFRSTGQDLYFPEFDDSTTNFGRALNLDRDRREHAFLKLTRGSFTLVSNFANREKQIPTGAFGTIFNDPAARTTDRLITVALQHARTMGERAQLNSAISYNSYDYQGTYPYVDYLYHDYARGRWWIGEANYVLRIGRAHKLVTGGEYQWNARQAQGGSDVTSETVYFRDNTRADNWGVFAQDEIQLGRRVLVNAGLRYDHYPTFGGSLNPRLAVIYHQAGSAVKLLAGRAFRAPNNYERYYADGMTNKRSPDLGPENVWTVEAVVERQLARRWRMSLSGYQYRIAQLISLTTDPADDKYVYNNVDEVAARGVEIETEGELGGLNLRASYGLQRAEDRKTGAELSNSPRHLAKVGVSRDFLWHRLTLGVEMRALSARHAPNGGRVPGFAVANLSLRTQGWLSGLSAGFSVYNLLDKAYGDPGSEEHLQTVIPQDRRSFRATLKYAF